MHTVILCVNVHMQVELCLLREHCKHAERLHRRLTSLYSGVVTAHGGWEQLLEELASCDFTPLQDQWLQAEFRYLHGNRVENWNRT